MVIMTGQLSQSRNPLTPAPCTAGADSIIAMINPLRVG
jgi:hypothetical protein